MRKKRKIKRWLLCILPVILIGLWAGIRLGEDQRPAVSETGLSVTFLDVGQGNAVLLRSGEHAMLVDGGPGSRSSYVVSYLKKQGITHLDTIVTTHYDSDHISGTIGALKVFGTDLLLEPEIPADSEIYRSYDAAADEYAGERKSPTVGQEYPIGDASFMIVAPSDPAALIENNRSIGIRVTCGRTHFLLLGDAEFESEYAMLDKGRELQADVYLASHHGSASSSSERLLEKVDPKAVVISCGAGNPYGHPSEEVMGRLYDHGYTIYRTDLQGTITAVSDGEEVRFDVEPCSDYSPGSPGTGENESGKTDEEVLFWVANARSGKYHRNTCANLPGEKNRVYYESKEDAEKAGYVAGKCCNP